MLSLLKQQTRLQFYNSGRISKVQPAFNSLFLYYNSSMSLRKAKQLLEKKKQNELQSKIEEDQEELPQKNHKINTFAMFDASDSDEDTKHEIQKLEKQETQVQSQQAQEKKKKKKKKKNKNKDKKQYDQQDQEVKEVKQTLKQLNFTTEEEPHKEEKDSDQWACILEISEGKFNYEKQLRRHFRGWQPERAEGDPDLSKKQQKMQKHLKKLMKKSILSPGITQYFPIRQKFEMERQDNAIRFQASKKYDSLQKQYDIIRNSNDINAMFQFTQLNPQHVDSLYAVGEFLRLQGNYRDADNLIQRVIYIYQMAGGYDLAEFIKESFLKKYIVYDQTSTSFFMSLFKLMDILGKKGCFRTALEYNKFLLKININDPTACLLCMDYNAISSKQFDFLLKFVQYFSSYCGLKHHGIYLMPNFCYSVALAKMLKECQPKKEGQLLVQENRVEAFLQFTDQHWNNALVLPVQNQFVIEDPRVLILRAIMVYPKLIIDIATKNEYSKQFLNHQVLRGWQKKPLQQILGHQFWTIVPTSYSYHFLKLDKVEDSQGLDKVLEVYVQRSKILWKSNNVILWVKGALGFVLNKIDQKFDYQAYLQGLCLEEVKAQPITFSLSRYSKINRHNFSDRVQRIDLNNIQDNQQMRQPQGQTINMNQNPFALFLNSLLPWVNIPSAQQGEAEHDPDMPFIEQDDG